jgi:spermidine synthase
MTVKAFVTKAMAHLPIVVHGGAEDTLVICFGMGTTYRSALTHGGRVDVVELTPGVFDSFDEFFADAAEVRANPRGRMIVNDGRNFLLLTRKRYDVITLDPPPPIDAAGVNNLYSREFLELMRAHLKPGGIVAHWLPPIGRGAGIADGGMLHVLVATFFDVFPHVRVIPSQLYLGKFGFHLLGSNEPFTLDRERLMRALENPAVAADMDEFSWDRLQPERFLYEAQVKGPAGARPELLTDDHPVLEFNLIRNLRAGRAAAMVRIAP